MTEYSPDSRMLPGSGFSSAPLPGPPATSEISFRQIFGVLRRRYRLVLLMALLGVATGAYLASRDLPLYQARAVLRVAGERRALTGGMEGPAPEVGRSTDPILSLVHVVQSRSVLGAVVDSLGLQLQSRTPDFPITALSQITVDRQVVGDSVSLTFEPDHVAAQFGNREVSGAYGEVLPIGPVRFAVVRHPGIASAVVAMTPREKAIDWLLATLSVTARTETDLVDVAFISTDAQLAQQIVNSTVAVFQAINVQTAKEKSRRRRIVLEGQLAQIDSTLALAQSELASFRSRLQIGSSESKLASQQQALLALDERRLALESDRRMYARLQSQLRGSSDESQAETVRALASSPAALSENPQVAELYRRLSTYQYRLDSMTTGPGAAAQGNQDVIALRNMVKSTQAELAQAVNAHVRSLDARMNDLADVRQRGGQSIQTLPTVVEEEIRLSSRVQSLDLESNRVRQEHQRASMAEDVEAGDVEIIDWAEVPYAPLSNTMFVKFALGLALGLFLGGGLAFLLEALNTSIRRPEDIESMLHLPGLAIIPRLTVGPAPNRHRLGGLVKGTKAHLPARSTAETIGTATEPFSVGIEAFRMLRTSLIWSDGAEQLRTFVVTSAAPGEGKTLTAANLAVSFAHDGLRVLLVDCDVRRPRLHGLFRMPRSPGLLDLLAPLKDGGDPNVGSLSYGAGSEDHDSLEHVLRTTPIRGLTLMTCGSLPTNPSNLLSGIRMQLLLKELKQRFDIVIIDTPPILATADAGILGSLVDGVLLVVRAGQTDRSAAQRAHQQLANVGARVVGAVLNDPQGELAHFGDYYYPYEYAPEKG